MGLRYLSEGNYEEAIIAFTAAIEIAPKLPEAYIGLADVYTAQGDIEKAKEILNQALSVLGENEAISSALNALTPSELQPLDGYPKTERVDFGDEYCLEEYNEAGKLIWMGYYSTADDLLNRSIEYVYDESWRLTAIISYNEQGLKQREEIWDPETFRCTKMTEFITDGREHINAQTEYLYIPDSSIVTIQATCGDAHATFSYTMLNAENMLSPEIGSYHLAGDNLFASFLEEYDVQTGSYRHMWVSTDGRMSAEEIED